MRGRRTRHAAMRHAAMRHAGAAVHLVLPEVQLQTLYFRVIGWSAALLGTQCPADAAGHPCGVEKPAPGCCCQVPGAEEHFTLRENISHRIYLRVAVVKHHKTLEYLVIKCPGWQHVTIYCESLCDNFLCFTFSYTSNLKKLPILSVSIINVLDNSQN